MTPEEEAAFAPYQGFVVWGFRGFNAAGNREVALEVAADNEDAARALAATIFVNWLTRAEIQPQGPPAPTLIESQFIQSQRWFELRMLAKDLNQAAEQYELAVIVVADRVRGLHRGDDRRPHPDARRPVG